MMCARLCLLVLRWDADSRLHTLRKLPSRHRQQLPLLAHRQRGRCHRDLHASLRDLCCV